MAVITITFYVYSCLNNVLVNVFYLDNMWAFYVLDLSIGHKDMLLDRGSSIYNVISDPNSWDSLFVDTRLEIGVLEDT